MLTATAIQKAQPREKWYLILDSDGLYLRVNPGGIKAWVCRVTYQGKTMQTKLGEYPLMTIAEARRKRDELKMRVRSGLPASEKVVLFEDVYMLWTGIKGLGLNASTAGYRKRNTRAFDLHVLPRIKDRPIKDITRQELMEIVDKLAFDGKVSTARRCAAKITAVFSFAQEREIIEKNPALRLSQGLPQWKKTPMAHISNEQDLGRWLAAIKFQPRTAMTDYLQFLAYCFPRPGEAILAEWKEVDLDQALWKIPAGHAKLRREHLIPLSRQAVEILRGLRVEEERRLEIIGQMNRYVFPTKKLNVPLAASTIAGLINRIIVRSAQAGVALPFFTPHGFRHTASTLLHRAGFNSLVIEKQMAHLDPNRIRSIYNAYDYLPERRLMMQWYADYLDALRDGTPVPEMPR